VYEVPAVRIICGTGVRDGEWADDDTENEHAQSPQKFILHQDHLQFAQQMVDRLKTLRQNPWTKLDEPVIARRP
jgi:hypothetical protein